MGAAAPLAVSVGWYSVGGPEFARVGQAISPAGTYSLGGVMYSCPAGRYGTSTGSVSVTCDGGCADGYVCPPGSTAPNATACPTGAYCANATLFLCPAGRYNNNVGASNVTGCSLCGANTFSTAVGAVSPDVCTPCAGVGGGIYEGSNAGDVVCWPVITQVAVRDPPPTHAGVDVGDQVSVYFSKPTDEPVRTDLVTMSASIGTFSMAWLQRGAELLLTVTNTSTTASENLVEVGRLMIGVLCFSDGSGVRDSTGLSSQSCGPPVVTSGSWGVVSAPRIVFATALDTGQNAGCATGDTLMIVFDQNVDELPVSNQSAVDALLYFSAPLGTGYTGVWVAKNVLRITIVAGVGGAAGQSILYAVGAFSVTVHGPLRSADGLSDVSTSQSVLTDGTWGDVPAGVAMDAHSATALLVTVALPPLPYAATLFAVDVSLSADFAPGGGVQSVVVPVGHALVGVNGRPGYQTIVRGLALNAYYYGRARIFNLLNYSGYTYAAPATCATSGPVVTSVTAFTTSLSTSGGDIIRVAGTALGANGLSNVSLSYTNSYGIQYEAQQCAVLTPYVLLQCLSEAGVGKFLRFVAVVDSAASAGVNASVAYSAPTIQGFKMDGDLDITAEARFATNGGTRVRVQGTSFGPTGAGAIERVTYTSLMSGYTFVATDCNVTVGVCVFVCGWVRARCACVRGV